MLYKPRCKLILDILPYAAKTEAGAITIIPAVIDASLERNHHLEADTLEVKIPWQAGGVDPRLMRNARCNFYLWDENFEPLNESKHLRFTGVCKSAKRQSGDTDQHVVLKFHDNTDFFLCMKPFPPEGIPDFTDDLQSAWVKICDHTGWWDPEKKEIVSSVKDLRDSLFIQSSVPEGPIGAKVHSRFHAVAKPTPPTGANAWQVWQYICGMLGVLSFIDGDRCVVTTDAALYGADPDRPSPTPPVFFEGHNITDMEEESDPTVSGKAVLLKSFNPVTRTQLEAVYPQPGDVRVKTPQTAAKRALKGGGGINANDVSTDLLEFFRYDITDQATLDHAAEQAYDAMSRQELAGSFKTVEMRLFDTQTRVTTDILNLRSGQSIQVSLDERAGEIRKMTGSEADKIAYLTDRLHYDPGLAKLIVDSIKIDDVKGLTYHVSSMSVHLAPESFEITCKYHNLVSVDA